MKMLFLELEDILDDDMDKANKANVADVSTIVEVKGVVSKLKF